MKHLSRHIICLLLTLTAVACQQLEWEEEISAGEPASTLSIRAIISEATAEISYPVSIFVFKNDVCEQTATLADADDALSLKLPEGNYNVYAIAGADAENYALPSQAEAGKTSVLSLREGKSHADLMTAQSNVSLTYGEEAIVTLGLQRKVMLVESIVINDVPQSVTGVSVTLSPLHEHLTIGGTYAGESGLSTFALTKDATTGAWKLPEGRFLLPAAASATIKVAFTTASKTTSYSYAVQDELAANHKIRITGNYNGTGVSLSGTVTGATWAGTKDITFSFNEDGSTESEDNTSGNEEDSGNAGNGSQTETAPAVGTFYKDACFVLRSETSGTTTTVTLMTTAYKNKLAFDKTSQASIKNAVDAAISKLAVSGIDGWRLPTEEEMEFIYNDVKSGGTGVINPALEANGTTKIKYLYYFQASDGSIKSFYTTNGNILSPLPNETDYFLRAFTTLTFSTK